MTTPADARAAELVRRLEEYSFRAVCPEWVDSPDKHGRECAQCGEEEHLHDLRDALAIVTDQSATIARQEAERIELLLDRHQPHRLSPCGHYRVFAMPLGHEDGSESPYCMQCDRDQLQAQLTLAEAAREEATKALAAARVVDCESIQCIYEVRAKAAEATLSAVQQEIAAVAGKWSDPEFWKDEGCRMDSQDCAEVLQAVLTRLKGE